MEKTVYIHKNYELTYSAHPLFFPSTQASHPFNAPRRMTAPIPAPRTLPFLGNVTQIEKEMPLRSYVLLARQYGEIYRLMQFCEHHSSECAGRTRADLVLGTAQSTIVVSSYRLAYEACDEKRFVKNPSGALEQVRNGVGDGLFTVRCAPLARPTWQS